MKKNDRILTSEEIDARRVESLPFISKAKSKPFPRPRYRRVAK